MTVAKINTATGEPTTTYGYAFEVKTDSSKGHIYIVWNTGTVTTDDTLRYYVDVRAGDLVYVKSPLANVAGKFLVNSTKYIESEGQAKTQWEVSDASDAVSGTYNRPVSKIRGIATKSEVESKGDSVKPTLSERRPDSPITTCVFYVDTNTASPPTDINADKVNWGAGNLIMGDKTVVISPDDTGQADVMITAAAGNTSQSGTTLNAGAEYVIYYPGTGNVLKCIRKAAYRNVENDGSIIIALCSAETESGNGANFQMLIDVETSTVVTGGGYSGDGTIKYGGTPFNITADKIQYGAIAGTSTTRGALEDPAGFSGLVDGDGSATGHINNSSTDDSLLIWDESSSLWMRVLLSELKDWVNRGYSH